MPGLFLRYYSSQKARRKRADDSSWSQWLKNALQRCQACGAGSHLTDPPTAAAAREAAEEQAARQQQTSDCQAVKMKMSQKKSSQTPTPFGSAEPAEAAQASRDDVVYWYLIQ